MQQLQDPEAVSRSLAKDPPSPSLAVLGTIVEFVSRPDTAGGDFCVLRGTVPPGVVVPLHSHEDAEDFLILAGSQQVLTEGPEGLQWTEANAGDYVRIPGGTLHAHRNVSDRPAVDLIVTTPHMGRFFEEVGVPVGDTPRPPSPEDVGRFIATSAAYGYTLGTPDQNAAVGIQLPAFDGEG